MSGSSPADLAVAFRSFARRLDEALEPVGGNRRVAADLIGELDAVIAAAASVMRSGQSASAVADALDARPADAWDGDDLDRVRALALDSGRLLRAIARAAEDAAG